MIFCAPRSFCSQLRIFSAGLCFISCTIFNFVFCLLYSAYSRSLARFAFFLSRSSLYFHSAGLCSEREFRDFLYLRSVFVRLFYIYNIQKNTVVVMLANKERN